MFIVPLNAFMTVQFTEAKSMGGVTGPYSVPRLALKIKNPLVGLTMLMLRVSGAILPLFHTPS